MKIATWNVNSLKVRLPQLLDWLHTEQPDVVCLQELKMEQTVFPIAEIEAAGYSAAWAGQKTYNGVAILCKQAIDTSSVQRNIPGFEDHQQRIIAITHNGIRIICAYFPNGQSLDSDKFTYKLSWLKALTAWLTTELEQHPRLILAGDFNIAPTDLDVYDPIGWSEQIHCSTPERAAFQGLCTLGLHDAFREFEQPEKTWSWWDYRNGAFRKNQGLRIDLILISTALRPTCSRCWIDQPMRELERPSDHAPVMSELILNLA